MRPIISGMAQSTARVKGFFIAIAVQNYMPCIRASVDALCRNGTGQILLLLLYIALQHRK